jgi:hypothetical protein
VRAPCAPPGAGRQSPCAARIGCGRAAGPPPPWRSDRKGSAGAKRAGVRAERAVVAPPTRSAAVEAAVPAPAARHRACGVASRPRSVQRRRWSGVGRGPAPGRTRDKLASPAPARAGRRRPSALVRARSKSLAAGQLPTGRWRRGKRGPFPCARLGSPAPWRRAAKAQCAGVGSSTAWAELVTVPRRGQLDLGKTC